MRNPLKDEDAAFRFLLGTIVYFAVIVLASWLATWLGLVAFGALSAGAVALLRSGKRPPEADPGRADVADTPAGGREPPP
jgi:hypothetical protein